MVALTQFYDRLMAHDLNLTKFQCTAPPLTNPPEIYFSIRDGNTVASFTLAEDGYAVMSGGFPLTEATWAILDLIREYQQGLPRT